MPAVFGLIVPHPPIIVASVGGERRLPAIRTIDALGELAGALKAYDPETLVVMSPHAPALADAMVVDDATRLTGSLEDFGDALGQSWFGDQDLAREIAEQLTLPVVLRSQDHRLKPGWIDHGSLVPLGFLDPGHERRLVILSLSYLPYGQHRSVGEAVREAARSLGRKVAFVASGDLSHRLTHDAPAGYSVQAAELDRAIVGSVERGRLSELSFIPPDLVEAGGECGLRSFIALGGFVGDDLVPTKVLSYEGPWGVGYLAALAGQGAIDSYDRWLELSGTGAKGGTPGRDESEIVRLARASVEAAVRGDSPPVQALSDQYPSRAGTFVSLHIGDSLRGCIGTIVATEESLSREVVRNAEQAALHDPRFTPVTVAELPNLDIKVDVLQEPEACSIEDLDPKVYGVIVSDSWRRGLLLPDLEGVDDVESQVAIAMSKAGISPGEPCAYERFRVDRYT